MIENMPNEDKPEYFGLHSSATNSFYKKEAL
jgi:hypothetical protein